MKARPAVPLIVLTSVLIARSTIRPASAAPASERDIQRAASYSTLGMKSLSIGDVEKARTQYQKALEASPIYPDALMGMGHLAMREGKFQEALDQYQKAKSAFAELGESIFDLRVKRFGDVQRQIASLKDLLQAHQNQIMTAQRNPLSTGDTNTSRHEREMAVIQDSIRNLEAVEAPTHVDAKEPPGEIDFHIGNALFRLDRQDEALAAWQSCAAKSPKFPMVQVNLAVAYWKKARFAEAKAALAKAAELGYPVNPKMKADLEAAAAAAVPPAAAPAAPPAGSAR